MDEGSLTQISDENQNILGTDDEQKMDNHWAVLVAGSKGYFNYRHHADVCHAYHLLRN